MRHFGDRSGRPQDDSGNEFDPRDLANPGMMMRAPVPTGKDDIVLSQYYATAGGAGDVSIWDYIFVISRRRWTVVSVLTAFVLTAVIYSFAATRLYTATALIQIQPSGPRVTDFDSVQEDAAQSQAYYDFFQTQYDILSSRTLARRTIDELDLAANPYINGDVERATLIGRTKEFVRNLLPSETLDPEQLAMEEEQRMVNRFLDEVSVRPRRKSFLVEVSYDSPDATLSTSIADTMARQYIDLTLDQSVEAASQARAFIEKQLGKVKGALEASERELQEFARGHEIQALEQEERVIHERLADLNLRLTGAEALRLDLEGLHAQTLGPKRYEIPQVMASTVIQTLREELTKAEAERAETGARFTEEFPGMKFIDARVAAIRHDVDAELERIIAAVQTDYRRAQENEDRLRIALAQQREAVARYEEKAVEFKIHQREVETNRNIYENLLHRMKEVEVTEAIRASNITLVDAPEVPLEPSSPRVALNLALSLILGLLGGVGAAFFQEYTDDSLNTPDDVERYLRLPTLGTIPEFMVTQELSDGSGPADLEVVRQPTSAGSEAIRTLRASLFLAAAGGLPTRLLLTSARPGEGKTCLAVNLATALAQMGRKVVLMDCDLRRPRVNKALSMELSPGVTNYLTGNMTLDEVVRPSGQPGLDVIAAGPIPPNPVDLLDSAVMAQLLNELEERYDHVLVDAPPALGFADVPIITNQLGGGCLLVTRAGITSRRLAKQACDYLIRMQSKLLGVVLNRVSTRRAGYSYYGYYGHYGDYYTRRPEDETLATRKLESAA